MYIYQSLIPYYHPCTINSPMKDQIITGDFNIDLLHTNMCNKEHCGDFLDLMFAYSIFRKITLPTRMAENSCTLIYNIFCTLSPYYISSPTGIFYLRIADHHRYFLSICPNGKGLPNNQKICQTKAQYWGSIWKPEARIGWKWCK